jgi:glucokinase
MQRNSDQTESDIVGVDVGGTKIAAALVDARGGLSAKTRCPTDTANPEATLDSIAAAVQQVIRSAGLKPGRIKGVGLGIPGSVDPELGLGLASVNLNWRDVAVVAGLQARLDLPCRIENDVKAAGLGEAHYGAGQGKRSLIFLTVGTGVAASVVLDNKIWHGTHGLAGEIGHTVFDPHGPLCKCGGTGCLEALVSGPAIAARAAARIRPTNGSKVADETFTTAQKVFEAVNRGDELALQTVDETGFYLAQAVQWLALSYDPDVIVLGGGVSQAGDLLLAPMLRHAQRLADASWVFGGIFTPQLVQISRLGENSGILGAAALFAGP